MLFMFYKCKETNRDNVNNAVLFLFLFQFQFPVQNIFSSLISFLFYLFIIFLSLPFVSFLRLFRHLILLLCVYFNEFHHQTLLSKLKLLESVIFAPSVSLLLLIPRQNCEHTLCQGIFQEKFRIACCIRRKKQICRPWIWKALRISRVITPERVINYGSIWALEYSSFLFWMWQRLQSAGDISSNWNSYSFFLILAFKLFAYYSWLEEHQKLF